VKRFTPVSLLVAALVAFTAAGCSKDHKIEVVSDTCWIGQVDNGQTMSECGNVSYKIIGSMKCVRVTKQFRDGYVHVRVDGGPWAETTDSAGVAQACR